MTSETTISEANLKPKVYRVPPEPIGGRGSSGSLPNIVWVGVGASIFAIIFASVIVYRMASPTRGNIAISDEGIVSTAVAGDVSSSERGKAANNSRNNEETIVGRVVKSPPKIGDSSYSGSAPSKRDLLDIVGKY